MEAVRPKAEAAPSLWYKDAVIYELHVRAFHDSNADGIGDIRGLIQKLDYLQDLGVTAIWLRPFSPSPLRYTQRAGFAHVPPVAGALEYRQRKNEPMTLGSHTNCNTPNEVRAPYELCDVQESGKSHQRRTAI